MPQANGVTYGTPATGDGCSRSGSSRRAWPGNPSAGRRPRHTVSVWPGGSDDEPLDVTDRTSPISVPRRVAAAPATCAAIASAARPSADVAGLEPGRSGRRRAWLSHGSLVSLIDRAREDGREARRPAELVLDTAHVEVDGLTAAQVRQQTTRDRRGEAPERTRDPAAGLAHVLRDGLERDEVARLAGLDVAKGKWCLPAVLVVADGESEHRSR